MIDLNSAFQRFVQFYGGQAGDIFDVYRPDYNQTDNTPQLVYPSTTWRRDPTSVMLAEPKFRDVDFYELFGNREVLQPGDLLIKSTPDGGQTPPVTFLFSMPTKAAVGFRTSRIGMLTNQVNEPIYTNVYFDFLGTGYPGSSINPKLEDSLRIPSIRVIIFKRDNLFRLRTQLVETDDNIMISKDGGLPQPYQRKWKIEQIDQTGNIMILTLSQALKD